MINRTLVTSVIAFLVLFTAACDNNDPGCDTVAPAAGNGPTPRSVADGDFTTTASGLKYFDFETGAGPMAAVGDSIYVHYTGWLTNGYIFDSSVLANRRPLPIRIGFSPLIPGWTEGLQGLQEGGQRQLVLPPELAYGDACDDIIPANSVLIFEIEIVSVVPADTGG